MGELVLLLERQRKRAGPINLRCDPGVPFTHRSAIDCTLALKLSRWLVLLRKQVKAAPKRTSKPFQTPPEPTQGPWGWVWCSGGFKKTRKAANGANGANGADGADGPNGADGADRADPHGNTPHARTHAHTHTTKGPGVGLL